ncbi:MAG: hypothetical protein ABSE05_05070 [Syntrophales bacterium]|jgi:hypothetical protein
MHLDKRQKKFTIIVIRDERRLCSFKLPANLLTISLVTVIGLCIISFTAVLLHNRMGGFKEELTANIGTHTKPLDTGKSAASADSAPVIAVTQSYNLSIENFEANFDLSRKLFRYSFLLKNKTSKNAPASGYIFLILKSDGLGAEDWLADPQTNLSNGVPQNFKEGDPFSITRHKVIAKDISIQHVYGYASIFVFSDDGKLVLKEIFNLKT